MMGEDDVQSSIRIGAAQAGVWLGRNNVGVLRDATGRVVRFGLANDSQSVNKVLKSGDLIGPWSDGIFTSIEVKREGWKYRGTPHEQAQLNWINLVRKRGGYACFATSWEEAYDQIRRQADARSHPGGGA